MECLSYVFLLDDGDVRVCFSMDVDDNANCNGFCLIQSFKNL